MRVLVDTGVWYAICDPRDRPSERDAVDKILEALRFETILVPWPVLYETLRTRFSKNTIAMAHLGRFLRQSRTRLVDDAPYRDAALNTAFAFASHRPMSLVDCLLRLMLEDRELRIDRLATYNARDFVDVCGRRKIEILA